MAKKKEVAVIDNLPAGAFPSLNALLVKDDKKGLFNRSTVSLGMPTGFLPLDYRNGYKMKVYNREDDSIMSTYNNIGIFGGTFNTIIGKTGTAKTTLAAQMSANISRYFEKMYGKYAEIYHIDAEQASNYTRIKTITGLSLAELDRQYHLNQEINAVEDIFEMMKKIAHLKEAYKEQYMVNTGIKNEFNEDIKLYVPTILIIDSLPSITTLSADADKKKEDELKTGTHANRVAKAISAFYKQSMALVKKYNFIVFAINHINKKIEIGGMPTAPQTMYMKMDESIPCGFAPLYYAHNIFKIVAVQKKVAMKKGVVEDGYDGFRARIELLKSRSNKAGQFCHLIYNQEIGFDPYMSLYDFLDEDKKLIEGRNPYRYIKGFENVKFDNRKFEEEVGANPDLKDALYSVSVTALDEILSNNKFTSLDPSPSDIGHIINNLRDSYNSDESFTG